MKRRALIVSVFLLLTPLVSAVTPNPNGELRLNPLPKEFQLREGSFRVTAATTILVAFGHQDEDRIAAETLAEEIMEQSGLKIAITGSKEKGKQRRSTIELARLQDHSVRDFLQSRGLKADAIGDQGYLLFSDSFRLVVAANTGQGLFYGVQTLRQLLHPEGKDLVCPAVSIRDWPSMEWRGMHDNLSRGPIPAEKFVRRQIRTLAGYKIKLFSPYVEPISPANTVQSRVQLSLWDMRFSASL